MATLPPIARQRLLNAVIFVVKPNFRLASSEAARLLAKHGFTKPPIDPEEIAESEGLDVRYAEFLPPFDETASGFFDLKERAIFVNSLTSDKRITFTIAHELAHYLLHKDYIRSQDYIPMPRNNEYPSTKPLEEVEADTFAANLLVPLTMLERYKDVASVPELARLFFVSNVVIRNRLDLLERFPSMR